MRRIVAILFGLAVVAGGGAAAAEPSRTLDDYVVLGLERVHLKDLALVASGDVGVNDPVGLALVLGPGSTFANGTTVVGDWVRGDKSTLYDLYTNRLMTSATGLVINGVGPLPTGPLPLIAPLPPLPAFAPGTGSFIVAGDVTLPPGAYGNVVVRAGQRLHLVAGTYEMRVLKTGRNAAIVAEGPVTINVQGALRVGNGSSMKAGAAITAQDVVVNVGGTVSRFGAGVTASLVVYAPRARLTFGRGFRGTGQFVGRIINSDHSTGFSRGDCGNGVVEPSEQCDPPDGVSCDAACQLVTTTTTTTSSTTTTSTSSSTTTSTSTSTTTTSTSTTTTDPPPTTTTTTTMPVAICGNNEVEFPEECDPPGAACPPDGVCLDDCSCLFGGSS